MRKPIMFRNQHGELVPMPQYSITEAKRNFDQLLDAVERNGPVIITKRGKPTAVVISAEAYRALAQWKASSVPPPPSS